MAVKLSATANPHETCGCGAIFRVSLPRSIEDESLALTTLAYVLVNLNDALGNACHRKNNFNSPVLTGDLSRTIMFLCARR